MVDLEPLKKLFLHMYRVAAPGTRGGNGRKQYRKDLLVAVHLYRII